MDWSDAIESLGTGWLITIVVLFAGVLYWGFGSRRRQGRPPNTYGGNDRDGRD